MWFIGVEVEQETSAPPPKKNPGSAPETMNRPAAFLKGSLTWENNAIFSSHCFTLLQRRNSTINSERDHNLKPLKTDISTIEP